MAHIHCEIRTYFKQICHVYCLVWNCLSFLSVTADCSLLLFLSLLSSLRLFQKFDTFRILVCGGDGSVGWVLSEIDSLNLHKQVPAQRAWWDERINDSSVG